MNNIDKEFPDYFQDVSFNFKILDNMFEKQEMISFLQIGAYTGDATTWLLNKYANQANFKLTDVDTWGQGDSKEMQEMDFSKIEKYYLARTESFRISGRLRTVKATSDEFFLANSDNYDFIYLDGNHQPEQVAKDGINCFNSLRVGGILAFDDYLGSTNLPKNQRPKIAIDFVRDLFSESIEILESNYQFWIKKIDY